MTAGFLKGLSESAGTPVCETRRLSLSERRSEKLTHSETEMMLAIPRFGGSPDDDNGTGREGTVLLIQQMYLASRKCWGGGNK
jgi:hypothetical protein